MTTLCMTTCDQNSRCNRRYDHLALHDHDIRYQEQPPHYHRQIPGCIPPSDAALLDRMPLNMSLQGSNAIRNSLTSFCITIIRC
uniref:Uncharacterized protein n=1 Tax=Parascaris equorum TaxID=6256 RepID=A0A914S702_PAREQ